MSVFDAINSLIRRGEYLAAMDQARLHLKANPGADDVRYLGLLALARSGATKTAIRWYTEAGLANSDNTDYRALGARLAKDLALASSGTGRIAALRQAAAAYHRIHDTTGEYYPAINAATLYRLSGDIDQSRELATECINLVESSTPSRDIGEYYRLATLAEAHLLLGNHEQCRRWLERACLHAGGDYSAMSSTRKQLKLLLTGPDSDAILAPLRPPDVIHFCGHMMSADRAAGRFLPNNEAAVTARIRSFFRERPVGFGFGSLASGADILVAEALLQVGADLHVVLPFQQSEFLAVSVAPAGAAWVPRFETCLKAATSVSYATEGSYLRDDHLFHLASRLAMGLALQKASDLGAQLHQLAVWDGGNDAGPAGTAADIRFWQSKGLQSTLLASDGSGVIATAPEPVSADQAGNGRKRKPHAMLFGDVKGFSKLPDECLPAFVDTVLGEIGGVLREFESVIDSCNTWGDGLFVVFSDAVTAAHCALRLQAAMAALALADRGLPPTLALRLGIHFGPVYEMDDPILRQPNFFGADVSKAARIEPITPVGEVYVTRQMAAELALEKGDAFTTEYVGQVSAAKNYGEFPMYWLRPTTESQE